MNDMDEMTKWLHENLWSMIRDLSIDTIAVISAKHAEIVAKEVVTALLNADEGGVRAFKKARQELAAESERGRKLAELVKSVRRTDYGGFELCDIDGHQWFDAAQETLVEYEQASRPIYPRAEKPELHGGEMIVTPPADPASAK